MLTLLCSLHPLLLADPFLIPVSALLISAHAVSQNLIPGKASPKLISYTTTVQNRHFEAIGAVMT